MALLSLHEYRQTRRAVRRGFVVAIVYGVTLGAFVALVLLR